MLTNDSIIITIIISINILSIIIGYLLGKINCTNGVTTLGKNKNTLVTNVEKVSIDDTKFVTAINTKNLEKKFDSLGDKKSSGENISSAVDKLKGMKG